MTVKQRIYKELQNNEFPDLKFLYSPDALDLALEVLRELLSEEKKDFENKLKISDQDIDFEVFDDDSQLSYYFSLLEHYQSVHSDESIRKIIEEFEPEYISFGNEIAYSTRYYDMLKICVKNSSLDSEQSKILTEAIEKYELRGINL